MAFHPLYNYLSIATKASAPESSVQIDVPESRQLRDAPLLRAQQSALAEHPRAAVRGYKIWSIEWRWISEGLWTDSGGD
jgi:hypothetical protein